MRTLRTAIVCLLCAGVLAAAAVAAAKPADGLGGSVPWQPLKAEEVKAQALSWLEAQKADAAKRDKAAGLWNDLGQKPGEIDVLVRLAGTFAVGDDNAARLLHLCAKPKDQLLLPAEPWLKDEKTAAFVRNNLRVLYGRWLIQHDLYDEALEQLQGLQPSDVAAPAMLLFYQGVACHTLLERENGLKSLSKLIEGADESPRRYVALARLMQEDLKSLKDDSLDHVARRMNDVRRRLDNGHAGKKVRGVEDGIIESLDKIIKKLEDQQGGGGGGGGGGSPRDNIRSSAPAPDSVPIGGKGPGQVDRKNIGTGRGWGDLPAKERDEALQKIGRDFPSHFRDIAEEYFRRIAQEGSK